jgi:plastocyanin
MHPRADASPSRDPLPLNEETDVTSKLRNPLLVAVLSLALAAASSCNSSSSAPTGPGGGAKELNSGDLGPGAVYQHTFATAGTYAYHCIHHGPMTGSVEVNDNATETVVNVSITSSTTPFAAASVKPGGRVVWTNNTGMVHTVTSN